MKVKQFTGARALFTPRLHLYGLDYNIPNKKKTRSSYLIFRPEYVQDQEIWKQVRNGRPIPTEKSIEEDSII